MTIDDINRIAVLGAGNMGHGIAEVAALAGYEVNLRDIKEEFVQNGYDQIEWSLGKLAEKERITQEEADASLDRVTPFVEVSEAVGDVDVVIEAVPEKMEIKKDVYGEVEEHAPEDAIFATNTSSLSITELSEVTERPEQFCGMHFFNPPVRMQLVEVISGAHSSEGTLSTIEDLAEDMGKTPVRVRKDSPGFIVNRILVPLMNEAAWIVHSGDGTVAEVDSTTKFEMGHPMGSFELADQVGIDVGLHVLEYMHEVLGDAYRPCPLLVEKVEEGKLGKKTGEGFYDYDDGGARIPNDEGSEEIEHRLEAVMANEVAHLIGNDVAPAGDIDEAVMLGAAFPSGPAKMADEVGLDTLLSTLEALHEETGEDRYEPVEYLRERVEEGGFYEPEDEEGDDHSYETLAVSVEDRVGRVSIDRPHRMNSLDMQVLNELETAIEAFEDDDEVRSILLSGEGDRSFSAGADLQGMVSGGVNPVDVVETSRKGQHVFGKLKEVEMPVVAAIDGYCLGGGMELSMCADMRLASERSQFGQPEIDYGLIPGWGGTQRLAPIVGEGRAREIILTGERYDAETMHDYGFVNELLSAAELDERAFELAADLAAGPPVAQRYAKRAMFKGESDTNAGLEIECQSFGQLMSTEDVMTGMMAFMGDAEPDFEGK